MICSSCGTNVDDSLEFCPNCSVRNENYKNPFISSNSDIGNISSNDSFSTTSNDHIQGEEASVSDESNDSNSNADDTDTVKHDEDGSIDIDNTESNTHDNTLPPIENISTPSGEVFKTEESNNIPPVNDIPSGLGEVSGSTDVSVDKKILSKKNTILIIGGVVILVIVLFLLFILNIIFAKSPEYVLAQMLKQESSLKYERVTYDLKLNTVRNKAVSINVNGVGNIEDLKGKIVKYNGIDFVTGNINTGYSLSFNIGINSESIYSNNNFYFRVTKVNPQTLSSLFGLKLNSWAYYTFPQPSIKSYLNFSNIKNNMKNIKIKVIGNSVIDNIPVTEYSLIFNNKLLKSGSIRILKNVPLSNDSKLNLWIDTSNYDLYKIVLSTVADNYNLSSSMNFSNINQPFSVSVPSSYTKYKFAL